MLHRNNNPTTRKPMTGGNWTPLIRSTSCPTYLTEDYFCNLLDCVDQTRKRRRRRRTSRRQSWNGIEVATLSYRRSSSSSCSISSSNRRCGGQEGGERSKPQQHKKGATKAAPFRKARIAITGGTMVGVGLVMIPLPTPFGCVVAGAGLSVLGKEFPAAQRLLDNTKGAIKGKLLQGGGKDNSVQGSKVNKDQKEEDYPQQDETEVLDDTTSEDDVVVERQQEDTIIFSSSLEESSLVFDSPGMILQHRPQLEEDVFVRVWTA